MNEGTSEPRRCEVCGDLINRDNKYGICQRTAECRKIRARKKAGRLESRYCEACGRRLNSNNQSGVCAAPAPECAEARRRKRRKANPKRRPSASVIVNAGDTFGRLTVLDKYSPDRVLILVRCECGTEKRVGRSNLTGGWVRSCGCLRKKPRARVAPYLAAGAAFNRLTAVEDVARCDDYARFRCECGGETTTKAVQVKLGLTKSCGCLTRTHGFSKHALHPLWHSMIQRCTNPNHKGYGNYGGRRDATVTVCERWRDPWLFAEDIYREIGARPEGKNRKGRALYELDRIDNDRGYWCGHCDECASKGQFTINVRWSDKKTQRANQRTIADLTRKLERALARAERAEAGLAELRAVLASRR